MEDFKLQIIKELEFFKLELFDLLSYCEHKHTVEFLQNKCMGIVDGIKKAKQYSEVDDSFTFETIVFLEEFAQQLGGLIDAPSEERNVEVFTLTNMLEEKAVSIFEQVETNRNSVKEGTKNE